MLNKVAILMIAAFLAVCHAQNNIVYFQPGGCNKKRAHVSCVGYPANHCCLGGSPWCGSLMCDNCPPGTATWVYDDHGCGGAKPDASKTCTESGNGAHCCTNLDNEAYCSAIWFTDFAAKRDELALRALTAGGQGNCTMAHEPNKMVFMDDKGVSHEIHMPKGTFANASQHHQNSNWGELQKFPAWANQTYGGEDC